MAASATAPAAAPTGAVSAGAYSSSCALQGCLWHLAIILAMPLSQDSSCGTVPVYQEGIILGRGCGRHSVPLSWFIAVYQSCLAVPLSTHHVVHILYM